MVYTSDTFDREMADIATFQDKFGLWEYDSAIPRELTERKLLEKAKHLLEELQEFSDAAQRDDVDGIIDALVDIVYVAKGIASMMNVPWEQHWNAVHAANMAKERGVVEHRGNKSDVTKPEGWQPPDHFGILMKYGFIVGNKKKDDPEHTP